MKFNLSFAAKLVLYYSVRLQGGIDRREILHDGRAYISVPGSRFVAVLPQIQKFGPIF